MEAAYRSAVVLGLLTVALALAALLLRVPPGDSGGAVVWRPQRGPQQRPQAAAHSAPSALRLATSSWMGRLRRQSVPVHKCAGGYLLARRRDTFWRYVANITAPKLADVAVANGSVYAVFNLKRPNRTHIPRGAWATSEWWFTFLEADGGGGWGSWGGWGGGDARRVRASTFGWDPHGHTLIVHAPLPASLRNWSTSDALHVTIAAPGQGVEYAEAPFCLYPPDAPTYTLVHCTQNLVNAKAAELFPEWVAYHAAEGFQHAYIYANGPPSPLAQALTPLVAAGSVTVVDWEWPPAYAHEFAFQQAQENSCLLRARGRASWVGLHDLDEFFQAMGPRAGGGGGGGGGNGTAALAPIAGGAGGRGSGNGTAGDKEAAGAAAGIGGVRAFLEAACPPSAPCREAALRVRCWFFAMVTNATEQAAADAEAARSGSPVLARFRGRDAGFVVKGREKALAQPGLVEYWSVHVLSKGGAMRTLNPATDLRLVHYKFPDRRTYNVTDGSMAAAAPRTLVLLANWTGSGWPPRLNGSAPPQAAAGGRR